MQSEIIKDINHYIEHLNSKGLFVSVHGKTVGGLIKHNIHNNPYCSFVKSNNEAWERCCKCQQKVFNFFNSECLFGMCYAGVEEYVFFVDSKTFISVSGYGIDDKKAEPRINSLAKKYYFDKTELKNLYNNALMNKKEDLTELKTLIKPLCHMLSLLQLIIGDISQAETKNKTFDSILAFVQNNITRDITLRSIADACACSESTVSHLFKEYTNQSVKKYVNQLRIKQAEKFLLSSDIPIGNIAQLCGFENSNYFSTAFKKRFGVSPTEYRAKTKKA